MLVFAGLGLAGAPTAWADEVIPGHLVGEGTHFEVTDSEYLNITVDCEETITIVLDSMAEMISMFIDASSEAATTSITVGGLPPQTTMYLYQDDQDALAFTTDAEGRHAWVQDLVVPHAVWIKPTTNTIYIGGVNNGCTLVGSWDSQTNTCTLTTDVYEPIYVYGAYTLDGAGHTISVPAGWAVYAAGMNQWPYLGSTVRNCVITDSPIGCQAYGSWATFTGNTVSGCTYGVRALWAIVDQNTISECQIGIAAGYSNTITGNMVTDCTRGIYANPGPGGPITGNTFARCGLNSIGGAVGPVADNEFIENDLGLFVAHSHPNVSGNTFRGNALATRLYYDQGTVFHHNNFIDNQTQVHILYGPPGLWYSPELQEGNYWSDYLGADDGSGSDKHAIAGDGIGDTLLPHPPDPTYEFDWYPFTVESGWENAPPVCQVDSGPFIVTAGLPFTLDLSGDDPDGDDLAVSAEGLPPGATISPPSGAPPLTASFDWTATADDKAGAPYDIAVTLSDPSGASSTCSFLIEDVNLPPVCDAGGTLIVEAESNDGALVTLSGTAGDPDDPAENLMFHWDAPVPLDDPDSPVASGFFPIAQSIAILTVTDGRGGVSVCPVTVIVQDTTPPEVQCVTSKAALWPPKHDMREVTIVVTATDACAEPDFVFPLFATISSDETDDAQGSGDGSTTGDVNGQDGYATPVVVTSCFTWDPSCGDAGAWVGTVLLCAERDGNGDGRAYIIEVEATDSNLNVAATSAVVVVPHDRRGGGSSG